MAVRLVVTFHATPGKGDELAQAMKARCEVSHRDAGCEQFEVFQSVSDPDKLVLLELWKDQAALDAHAKLQAQRPLLPEGLRLGAGEREDDTYNRTADSGRRQNAGLVFRKRALLRAREPAAGCRPAPMTPR